jgi:hypothetical protein
MLAAGIVAAANRDGDAWLFGASRNTAADPHSRRLERALFASIANYGVGHHFMNQASPYASRRLIESLARLPADAPLSADSTFRMRVRDLRHRFLGESLRRSFQRQVITSVGGQLADCPICWGWRARGGVSLSGTVDGLIAFLDAFASSRGLRVTRRRMVSSVQGIVGRHNIRQPRLWWSRDLLHSVLLDTDIREAGLFDIPAIHRKLQEHFDGTRDHFNDLLLAADLAYAYRTFLKRAGDCR